LTSSWLSIRDAIKTSPKSTVINRDDTRIPYNEREGGVIGIATGVLRILIRATVCAALLPTIHPIPAERMITIPPSVRRIRRPSPGCPCGDGFGWLVARVEDDSSVVMVDSTSPSASSSSAFPFVSFDVDDAVSSADVID